MTNRIFAGLALFWLATVAAAAAFQKLLLPGSTCLRPVFEEDKMAGNIVFPARKLRLQEIKAADEVPLKM